MSSSRSHWQLKVILIVFSLNCTYHILHHWYSQRQAERENQRAIIAPRGTRSAVDRCPTEVWQEIIKWAVVIGIRPKINPSSDTAAEQLSNAYRLRVPVDQALKEHASAWKTIYQIMENNAFILSHRGVNPYDWSLRLVCRKWNDLLVPLLFHTIRLKSQAACSDACHSILLRKHFSVDRRYYVRALIVEKLEAALLSGISDVASKKVKSSLLAVAELCTRIQAFHFDSICIVTAGKSGRVVNYLSNIDALHNATTFLRRASNISRLETLDLTRTDIPHPRWVHSRPPEGEHHLPTLTHLSINIYPSSTAQWLTTLADYDMPCLQHFFLRIGPKASLALVEDLLRTHGTKLSSLVISHAQQPTTDDDELAALSLCSNLEEFITDLSKRCSARPFPRLPRLRTIAVRGFAVSFTRAIQASPEHSEENYVECVMSVQDFMYKLQTACLPSLEVVKALDAPDDGGAARDGVG